MGTSEPEDVELAADRVLRMPKGSRAATESRTRSSWNGSWWRSPVTATGPSSRWAAAAASHRVSSETRGVMLAPTSVTSRSSSRKARCAGPAPAPDRPAAAVWAARSSAHQPMPAAPIAA